MPFDLEQNSKDLADYYKRNQNFFLPLYATANDKSLFLTGFCKAPLGSCDKENVALINLAAFVLSNISDFSQFSINLKTFYGKVFELFLSLNQKNDGVLLEFKNFFNSYLIDLYDQVSEEDYVEDLSVIVDFIYKNKTKFYNAWVTSIINCLLDEAEKLIKSKSNYANIILNEANGLCCKYMMDLQGEKNKDDNHYRKIITIGFSLFDIYQLQSSLPEQCEILGLIQDALCSLEEKSSNEEQMVPKIDQIILDLNAKIEQSYMDENEFEEEIPEEEIQEKLKKESPVLAGKRSATGISKAECTTSESEREVTKKVKLNIPSIEESPVNEEDRIGAQSVSYFFSPSPKEVMSSTNLQNSPSKEAVNSTSPLNPPSSHGLIK